MSFQVPASGGFVAFEPKYDSHAIQEVVFALTFVDEFSAAQLEALAAAHHRWKSELPKISKAGRLQISFGLVDVALPDPAVTMPAGVSFERIKPDGSLDWRLRADPKNIYVNCLSYTGWPDVWPKARRYLSDAADALALNGNAVQSILLQYVNIFTWSGDPATYDASELLRLDRGMVPIKVFDAGHLWHVHLGWFRQDDSPAPGRILERINLDAVEDAGGVPLVKVDSYLQLQLAEPIASAEFLNGSDERTFEALHDQTKFLLREFLTEHVADRIGLG